MFLQIPTRRLFVGEKNKKSDDRSVPPPGTPLQLFFYKTNTFQLDYIAIQHYLFCIILVYATLLISQIPMPPSFSSPLHAVAIPKRVSSSFATHPNWWGPETGCCGSLATAASTGSFLGQ